jgi:hypothetical protein
MESPAEQQNLARSRSHGWGASAVRRGGTEPHDVVAERLVLAIEQDERPR